MVFELLVLGGALAEQKEHNAVRHFDELFGVYRLPDTPSLRYVLLLMGITNF